MLTDRWSAIGVHCEMASVGLSPRDHEQAVELASALIEAGDRAYSRFRADSELRTMPHGVWAPISATFQSALAVALEAAKRTDGLVTPTVGRQLRLLGYDTDFSLVRRRDTTVRPMAAVMPVAPHWQEVLLDAAGGVAFVPEHCDLDLGATGKAHLADQIAEHICDEILTGSGGAIMINLGGDLVVRNDPQIPLTQQHRWDVGIDDDTPGDTAELWLAEGAVATSSTRVRTWRHRDSVRHHIIDPRTGQSALTPWGWVTVVASQAALANAASTAAIILGDAAPQWLTERDLAARLVSVDGHAVTTPQWPGRHRFQPFHPDYPQVAS